MITSKYKLGYNKTHLIKYKNYSFDKIKNKLYKNQKQIFMTRKELLLLSLLFKNQGLIVRYHILDKIVWYNSDVTDNARRTFIYRLKTKFNDLNIKIERNLGVGLF